MQRRVLLVSTAAAAMFALAPGRASADTEVIGDARAGLFSSRTENRNGIVSEARDLRARLRAGFRWNATERWDGTVRFAGHYSDEQTSASFGLHNYNNARPYGRSTLDMANVRYRPEERWSVTVGRMQTSFELEGVPKKSLDRNDSPNVDIDFTDGAHVIYATPAGWRVHGIVQHNPDAGATNVTRGPLDFHDATARQTLFLAFENKRPAGVLVQRGIDLTVIPDALLVTGAASGSRENYVAAVGRAALRWPVGSGGTRFLWGVELGYAPNTPHQAALKLGGTERADGIAWQTSFNVLDIRPGHSVGLVFGRAGSGWLVSPDFRENERLAEVRYQWKLDQRLSMESRLRERVELAPQTNAAQKRDDTDFYLRFTYKFN